LNPANPERAAYRRRGLHRRIAFKGRFIHSLGHAIGLSVHENLRFSPFEETIAEPGMVMTVEPASTFLVTGAYASRMTCFITKKGIEILTTAPRDFLEL
jgi:Xaa-Pro aminopeptidase